ncbi:MAG: hypothetical protein LBF88_00025 [Planctomycetaceae bacterium]|nr:hypothetical protein [Planctomycetaceae bacterium]
MSRNGFLATLCFLFFVGCNVVLLFADTAETLFKVSRAENLYGKGVHAFFDKDYSGAIDLLTQAEQLGSEDPRPYYFLALAHSRLKHNDHADDYFKKAAQFEWEGQSVRDYNISDALRRIQGNERLNIERYRTQAKLDWQNAEKRKREILYAKEKADEKRILTKMAKHPVAVVPFGAQSIDPLKTGKKIEVLLSNGSDSQPKTESPKGNATVPSDDTKKSKPDKETTLQKDNKKDENEEDKDEKEKDEKNTDDDSAGSSDDKTMNSESENTDVTTADDSDTNNTKDESEKEESEDDDPFK